MSILSRAMSAVTKAPPVEPLPPEYTAPQPAPAQPTKRWACSMINFYDNELTTRIVRAEGWRNAFLLAYPDYDSLVKDDVGWPVTLEQAKENAFNCDSMIHVEEIPEP